eukprot:5872426-Pleurochrysis_carterae.AAC.2
MTEVKHRRTPAALPRTSPPAPTRRRVASTVHNLGRSGAPAARIASRPCRATLHRRIPQSRGPRPSQCVAATPRCPTASPLPLLPLLMMMMMVVADAACPCARAACSQWRACRPRPPCLAQRLRRRQT